MPEASPDKNTLLSVKNLKIEATSYPPGEPPKTVTLVEGVSFDLQKGKVLGLIGESGAGKSTIGLSALAYGRGGVRITGGQVLLDGKDILPLDKNGIRFDPRRPRLLRRTVGGRRLQPGAPAR